MLFNSFDLLQENEVSLHRLPGTLYSTPAVDVWLRGESHHNGKRSLQTTMDKKLLSVLLLKIGAQVDVV